MIRESRTPETVSAQEVPSVLDDPLLVAHQVDASRAQDAWAGLVVHLVLASFLVMSGAATAEQICERVDEVQRKIAAQPQGVVAGCERVSRLLDLFKGAIGPLGPPPEGPSITPTARLN